MGKIRAFEKLLAAALALSLLPGIKAAEGMEAHENKGNVRPVISTAIPALEPSLPETVNLLLIGQDHKPEEPGKRSDSMILCTICPEKKTLTLTSILRDLYVEIPGYGKNRINAAYAFGGPKLLVKTLRSQLGVFVQGYIEVDFPHFVSLIDVLGGAALELRKDEAEEISRLLPGSDLHGGTCILSGEQVLKYVRIRNLDPDADVSRTRRQRKVLESVWQASREADPATLIQLLREALPLLNTDLNGRELLSIAGKVLPILKELKFESCAVPVPGSYRDLTVDGMAVLEADLTRNRAELGRIQSGS